MKITKTIKFYNKNYIALLDRYDSANMSELHNLFDKYILKEHKVLDIGFGSGRDLRYIKNITPNIYGIDASEEFVKSIKRDTFFNNRVYKSILPHIIDFDFKFDVIVSIAVFMHLTKEDIKETIENISKILEENGKIIISYSTKSRIDERDFYSISKEEMNSIFSDYGFKKIDELSNRDGLNRDIDWESEVYGKN